MEFFKTFCKSNGLKYILLLSLCLLLSFLSKSYDYDLFARLIVGEHFFANGSVSYKDFLSYTPTHLWYDHEWGSSVVFYGVFKLFGPIGLVLLHAVTMFITTVFILKTQQIQKHAYPFSLLFMAIFILIFSHLNPSIVRCHMFSFMFFAMFLYFLEKTKKLNSNILWLVPPIVIVWNNLHGGVVSGLGLIFIYFVGELLARRAWKKYFLVLLVSTPLLVINPYGVEYLDFLISANTKNREYITEWWPVFAHRHLLYYYPAFCIVAFTGVFSLFDLISKKNFNLSKILALFVTAFLAMIHVKLLSLALIVVAALYYNDIIRLFEKSSLRFLEKLSFVLLALVLLVTPFKVSTRPIVNSSKFPVQEVEFLKINDIKGNILTSFGLGSYVSYKLYPNNLIYMDGRYEEVYYDREFDALIEFEKAEGALWDNVLKFYPTEILMPEKTTPVYNKLQEKDSGWVKVFEGFCCGVFLRKEQVQKIYKQPSQYLEYYQKNAFETFGKFSE